MSDVQKYIGDELQRFTDEIFEFLRIPSVSANSDHDADIRRTAEWLRPAVCTLRPLPVAARAAPASTNSNDALGGPPK